MSPHSLVVTSCLFVLLACFGASWFCFAAGASSPKGCMEPKENTGKNNDHKDKNKMNRQRECVMNHVVMTSTAESLTEECTPTITESSYLQREEEKRRKKVATVCIVCCIV